MEKVTPPPAPATFLPHPATQLTRTITSSIESIEDVRHGSNNKVAVGSSSDSNNNNCQLVAE